MLPGNLLWMLLIGSLWAGQRSYAQCEKVRSALHDLRRHTTLKPEQKVKTVIGLQRQWLECGQPTDTVFIRLLIFKSDQFRLIGQNDSARKSIDQAIYFAKKSPPANYMLAQAYYLLGSLNLIDGRAEQAKKSFFDVLNQVTRQPKERNWAVQAESSLAYLYSSEGDYQQAIRHAEDGQQWALALRDDALRARLIREKAYALYWLSRYNEAAVSAQQAIRLAIAAHDITMERYYLLLGDIENRRGHTTVAIQLYRRASSLAQQSKDEILQAFVLTNLGFLHYNQKDYAQAIRCNQQALVLQKNVFSRARIFNNLGACFGKVGQFDEALVTYQKGLVSLPIGFERMLPIQNPPASSIRFIVRKEVLLTLIQDKADTWLDYAKAAGNNRHRLQYALNTYRVADQMIDFMRWEHTGEQSKLYWRQKTRSMYERAIETSFLLGNTDQAFLFLEKSRAVMLADKLNELGARQKLNKQQVKQQEQLQKAVSNQQSELANANSKDSSAYHSARMLLLAKQDSLNGFIKQLEKSNRAYYQLKYDSTVLSLAQMQRYLKKGSASLVTYFVGDSALYILGVTGHSVVLRRQPINVYNESLNQFTQLLSRSKAMRTQTDVNRFLPLSHRLYQQLLTPLSLPAGRVIVSPDGFFVPFDALSRSSTEARYIVDEYAFSYTYSASLLVKNEEKQRPVADWQTDNFLGVAPVRFASSLGQVGLPGSDKVLESIASRFHSPRLLTHEKATRRAFVEKAANARVIQLFTHAAADSTNQEPLLYFADSTLKLSDLKDGALLKTQLVVLTACKTGIGANQRGEGIFSLGRGFAAQGVPCVLTTLWSVQDQATCRLTDFFHKHLDKGLPKDIALQQAKRDWLREAGAMERLPNYWAGMIIVGDTVPLRQMNVNPWMVVSALLALAGFGGWFWYRQKRRATQLVSWPLPG